MYRGSNEKRENRRNEQGGGGGRWREKGRSRGSLKGDGMKGERERGKGKQLGNPKYSVSDVDKVRLY